MRIISGKWRGIRLQAPTNLPVRPTTDQAKEALFNILINSFDFDGLKIPPFGLEEKLMKLPAIVALVPQFSSKENDDDKQVELAIDDLF